MPVCSNYPQKRNALVLFRALRFPLRSLETVLLMFAFLPILGGCSSLAYDQALVAREGRYGKGRVAITKGAEGYGLTVEGQPFYIRGVGLGPGTGYPAGMSPELRRAIDLATESGANAIRTWSWEGAPEILDYCQTKGVMVCVGLWVAHERHGFEYGNAAAVSAQMERFRAVVESLKGHPALLLWGVGNEVETEARDMRVWDAVNDISVMIHEIDQNHPTMYVVADYFEPVVRDISRKLGDIDLIGVNSYANLANCLDRWDESPERRPLIVTEWGPSGWWEAPTTRWNAPIEPVSGIRFAQYRDNYAHIASRPGRVLGSFAFYWGQKQERTPTWFSLSLEGGILTEAADALCWRWTRSWPENRAPHLTGITLSGKAPGDSLVAPKGERLAARLEVTDPEGDPLETLWTVREETSAVTIGGDAETVPPESTVAVISRTAQTFEFKAPEKPGNYRLFALVKDGKGKAATGNFPFRVE